MLMTEWKLEDAIAIEREEGHQEGRKEVIQAMLETMPIEQVAKILKTTVEEINKIIAD